MILEFILYITFVRAMLIVVSVFLSYLVVELYGRLWQTYIKISIDSVKIIIIIV